VALDFVHRAVSRARELIATNPEAAERLSSWLPQEAQVLDSLGRIDEALALDVEWVALNPGRTHPEALMRGAIKYMAVGQDAAAELILRRCLRDMKTSDDRHSSKTLEIALKPHIVMAELLERKGTEEALAEARTLRDGVAQQLADYEAKRVAALEETRTAAAEAVKQWREERSEEAGKIKGKSKGKAKGKKNGKKKKGRRGRAKDKGASRATAIEAEQPREPAGGMAEGAAAVESAATAEAEQQAPGEESQPENEEEEAREECAICLQDLELEDDEGGEGEALVLLRCGHRFHEICGDMWCAKCADKRWGVTCPGCRAPYLQVRR
jgi:hypothetical protein